MSTATPIMAVVHSAVTLGGGGPKAAPRYAISMNAIMPT